MRFRRFSRFDNKLNAAAAAEFIDGRPISKL